MIDFDVGEDVVCVDAKDTHRAGKQEISEGKIYTIRWIGPYFDRKTHKEIIGVRLVGIFRGMYKAVSGEVSRDEIEFVLGQLGLPADHEDDPPFRAERFRSLEKNKAKEVIREEEDA